MNLLGIPEWGKLYDSSDRCGVRKQEGVAYQADVGWESGGGGPGDTAYLEHMSIVIIQTVDMLAWESIASG